MINILRFSATGQHILGVAFCSGLAYALMFPVVSYFLVEKLQVQPWQISLYVVLSTVSGVLFSHFLGKWADRGQPPKGLYLLSTLGLLIGSSAFALATQYWQVLLVGVLFIGLGNAALPQLLTLGRHEGNQESQPASYNAWLRAMLSLAWIGGPPLAFLVMAQWGFSTTFATSASLFFLTFALGAWVLPKTVTANRAHSDAQNQSLGPEVWWLGIAIVAGNFANLAYAIAMPIFVIKELHLPESLPGWALGLAAGLEIPFMIWAGRVAKPHSINGIIRAGLAVGFCFYLGMFLATEAWQILVLQALNGVFFGIFAGLGITIIQDQLPHRLGFATAFYSNAMRIGMVLGSLSVGLIAQFFSYQGVVATSLVAVVISWIAFWFAQRLQPEPEAVPSQ